MRFSPRNLLLGLLSTSAFLAAGVVAAWLLGLDRLAGMFVVGFFAGVAPRRPVWRRREDDEENFDGQSPALKIDPSGVVAYLRVRRGRHGHTVVDVPCVNADFDADGNLLGVEFVSWPLRDGAPAVPQAWPPFPGYDEATGAREDDNEGEEWKQ